MWVRLVASDDDGGGGHADGVGRIPRLLDESVFSEVRVGGSEGKARDGTSLEGGCVVVAIVPPRNPRIALGGHRPHPDSLALGPIETIPSHEDGVEQQRAL